MADKQVVDPRASSLEVLESVPESLVRRVKQYSGRLATEAVHGSPAVREAAARAFAGWCAAITDRLCRDGRPAARAEAAGLAVISLIEGALILSRTSGDTAALNAAKAAARLLLTV